jgi:hypothetical protein
MTDLVFRQECHQIVGCAMEVLNSIGHGFHEKSDENGLVVESPAPEHSKLKFPIMAKPVELVDLNEPRMDTNERE